MRIFQINWVMNPIELERRHGLISKEAIYKSLEIIIGPLQILLGRRVEINTYNV